MANAEHLEILKSGVEKWNEWRRENRFIKPDLCDAYLYRANLSCADLCDTYLYKANLSCADLCDAHLDRANLSHSDLSGTKLSRAGLSGANLVSTILSHADLSHSVFFHADLSNAKLSGTNLSHAHLSGAHLSGVNLQNANLHGANLHGAILTDTDFYGAKIGNTVFGLTDMSTCLGLETVIIDNPCTIDFQTLRISKNLPKSFLLKIGLPELLIDYLPEFYGDALHFYPVFLSHSWENKPFARKLYEALIAKGVNIFFDEKKMKPGDDIYESISKGIAWYDKMILVCSKESLSESWWVDRELDRVLKKERDLFKERGKRINLLIPIAIDDHVFKWDGAKAEEVRRYVVGDFKDWQDDAKFEKALNDLIHALNAERPDVKPKSLL